MATIPVYPRAKDQPAMNPGIRAAEKSAKSTPPPVRGRARMAVGYTRPTTRMSTVATPKLRTTPASPAPCNQSKGRTNAPHPTSEPIARANTQAGVSLRRSARGDVPAGAGQ